MNKTVRAFLAKIGSKGGKAGGKSKSPAKIAAVLANLKKIKKGKR